jgi:hypothetical protein
MNSVGLIFPLSHESGLYVLPQGIVIVGRKKVRNDTAKSDHQTLVVYSYPKLRGQLYYHLLDLLE